jgi:tetratricopeptide (TPR) repeat protein
MTATPHDAAARLRWELEVYEGFWIGAVRGEGPEARTRVRREIQRWCDAHELPLHNPAPRPQDMELLAVTLTRPDVPAGLHWIRCDERGFSPSEVERGYRLFLTRLNERRETLRTRMKGPLVFEGPPDLIRWLRELAPDVASFLGPVVDPGPDPASALVLPPESVWLLPIHALVVAPTRADYDAVRGVDVGAVRGSSWREERLDERLAVSFRAFATSDGPVVMVALVCPPNDSEEVFSRALTTVDLRLQPRLLVLCGSAVSTATKLGAGEVLVARRLVDDGRGAASPTAARSYHLPPAWERVVEHFSPDLQELFPGARLVVGELLPRPESTTSPPSLAHGHEPTLDLDDLPVTRWFLHHAGERPLVVLRGSVSDESSAESGAAAHACASCVIALLRRHPQLPNWEGIWRSGTAILSDHPAPSQLLDARHEVIPWHGRGREDLLAELDAWADSPTTPACRLLHGDGGSGKTRLAIEWCRRLRQRGWIAAFFPQSAPREEVTRPLAWGAPVLVVLDYAETRADLADLLRELRERASNEGPAVRVLLLARNDGDWFASLRKDDARGAWLSRHPPRELGPFAVGPTERVEIFEEASHAFAAILGRTPVQPDSHLLEDARFENALYLYMAALAAVEGIPYDASSLMDGILDHEEQYWSLRQGEHDDLHLFVRKELAREIITAATLRGMFVSSDDARRVVERCFARPLTPDDEALLERLHHIYARSDAWTWLPGLEPDLLGEAMVVRVATPAIEAQRVADDWIDRVFPDDDADALRVGFTVLGRASATAPGATRPWIERLLATGDLRVRAVVALGAAKVVGKRTAFSMLGQVLTEAMEARGDAALAEALERVGVPEQTVSLRALAHWTAETLRGALPVSDYPTLLAERARLLNNEAVRLGDLGRREEAMAAATEAVDLRRALAKENPDAFLPNLAMSLNNLGAMLSARGRREEAMAAAREAVDLRRALAKENPDTFLPDLAMSLTNLGNWLSDLGRREEAMAAAREAVDHYRAIAKAKPDAFLPNLAASLNNLGNRLSDLGRREEAMAAAREAVDLRRALAKENPDAFLPDLAASLNNLGNMLSALGRREEAMAAAAEAVDLRRALAKANPDAFLPDLAASLNNLGNRLSFLGRREEAMAVATEAVDLRRALAKENPDAFLPDLAMSVNNLGALLSALGRREEAMAAAREAVDHYRALAKANPDAFLPDLAASLNNLGNSINGLGRREEAMAAAREAVDHYRALAKANPDAFLPNLAMSLGSLGLVLIALERPSDALAVTREAHDIFWPLFERHPDAFARPALTSLRTLIQLHQSLFLPLPPELAARAEAFASYVTSSP